MIGWYGGPMTVKQLVQAIVQDKKIFFPQYGITHLKDISLRATPCDEIGETLVIFHPDTGEVLDEYTNGGYYRSAAEAFEKQHLKPKCFMTKPNIRPRSSS
jgi:hypothetical protein